MQELFTHFALHVAARQTDVKETALFRMHSLHQLCASIKLKPGIAAAACLYIQAHVEASSGTYDVCELYRQQKNPEKNYIKTTVSYPFLKNLEFAQRAWHAQPHEDTRDIMSKLMRKGGPAPSSVRYVAGLVKRCVAHNPDAIKSMICSHYLGGYHHSLHVADPHYQISLMTMPVESLVNYAIENCTTRQLHYMVSEFVCTNTNQHPALLWSVGPTAAHHVKNVARGTLRAFGRHTKLAKCSGLSCLMTLGKALNVNNNYKHSDCLSKKEIDEASKCVGMISPLPLLQKLNIGNEMEWKSIYECTENPKHTSLKAMRLQLKCLSKKTRQFLTHCVRNCIKSMRLRVCSTSQSVQTMQKDALNRSRKGNEIILTVCTCCTTLRSAVLGAKMPKTRAGVSVDLQSGKLYCNNCDNDSGIIQISMPGRFVTLYDKNLDPKTQLGPITVCTSCGFLTVVHDVVGEYPCCKKCYTTIMREQFRPQTCFCGGNGVTWGQTMHKSGSLKMDWFCKYHAHLIPDKLVERDLLLQVCKEELDKS